MPDRPLSRPLYQQIADDLQREIEEGILAPGSELPTETELHHRYAASRNTIREAIRRLARLHVVETRPGQGTFVLVTHNSSEGLGMSGIPTSEIVKLARSVGISDAETLPRSELDRQTKAKLADAAARHEQISDYYSHDILVGRVIIDHLYEIDQNRVAAAVSALRMAAQNMLGRGAHDFDLFGPDGDHAVGNGWDVLQNYAEKAFDRAEERRRRLAAANAHDKFVVSDYPQELIAASYDPAWRRAFGEWAEQNADLLPDSRMTSIRVHSRGVSKRHAGVAWCLNL